MPNIRLTAAQALVRYLAAQRSEVDGAEVPLLEVRELILNAAGAPASPRAE